MPRMQKSKYAYIVSFNGMYGEYEVGDSDMHSGDHEGDDIQNLADEVIADDPSFPLRFVRNEDSGSEIVGVFYSVDDDEDDCYVCAVMMTNSYFYY